MSTDPKTGFHRPFDAASRERWLVQHKKWIYRYWLNRHHSASYRSLVRDNIREAIFLRDYRLPSEVASERRRVRRRQLKRILMLP